MPGRVKGSLGTNHHDVEPKYMVSVIDMVQERETSVSVFLTQSSWKLTIKFLNMYKTKQNKNCRGLVYTITTVLMLTGELKKGCRHHHPVLGYAHRIGPKGFAKPKWKHYIQWQCQNQERKSLLCLTTAEIHNEVCLFVWDEEVHRTQHAECFLQLIQKFQRKHETAC